MKKLGIIITIIGLVIALFCIAGFITAAYGSDQDYQICVNNCYLDLPKVEECISDEKKYWDTSNVTDLQVKRDCKSMINYQKIDCRINCAVAGIKLEDAAVKYYDTNVKNFPLTNE